RHGPLRAAGRRDHPGARRPGLRRPGPARPGLHAPSGPARPLRLMAAGSRRLLSRLRGLMAAGADHGGAPALADVTTLIAGEMVAEVCTIYATRPGELLEVQATHGLNPESVGRTRLRVGEGIVGIAAATAAVQ